MTKNQVVVYPGKFKKAVASEESMKFLFALVTHLFLNHNGKLEKLQEAMNFISNNFLNGDNTPFEFEDVYDALQLDKFAYAYHHPLFWCWEKRLMFFVDLHKLVLSQDEKLKSMIMSIDLFDDDWRRVLFDNRFFAPLKRVLDKCGNVIDASRELSRQENRWVEGGEIIFFMKNCFENLTSTHMDELGVRCFSHINYTSDHPFYQEVEFLNHLATHFLFPKLWIKLYAPLFDAGYKF